MKHSMHKGSHSKPPTTGLHQGLTRKMPPAPSATPKGPSVNEGAVRDSTAPTPKTLGPRTA